MTYASQLKRTERASLDRLTIALRALGDPAIFQAVSADHENYRVVLKAGGKSTSETRCMLMSWRTRGWLREVRRVSNVTTYRITSLCRSTMKDAALGGEEGA